MWLAGRKNVKNKLRKVVGGSKESGLATISDPYESVRTFDSPLVFIAAGTNPWDLDERSFSPIASATTDSLSKLDVLSVITPPNRPRPVLEPPTIGSFKAYSDYSPSQTKLTVSNDTSPTMKGLSKKMVEIWLDREASGSRGDVAISSSLSIGMEGRDDEILMDDEDDEEDRMPFRGNIFKDIQPPSSTETDGDMFNTPAGSRCHRASFEQGFTPGFENHLRQAACSSQSSPNADPGYTNNAFDAFKNSPSNNNAEAVFRPFGLSPNVTLSRGKQMPPKFRGASTGSTMPSGPGVAQWRQNAPPGNRAVSHGTIEFPSSSSSSQLFGGFARNGHLMRKESILFEDENDREDRETFGYDDGIESREPFEYDDDMENWELFEDDMLL